MIHVALRPFIFLGFFTCAAQVCAQDFSTIFNSALEQNPQLKAQLNLTKASEAKVTGAHRSLGPTVQLKGNYTQREEDKRAFGMAVNKEKSAWFTLVWPLFKGGREYAGLSMTENANQAETYRSYLKAQNLYLDLTKAYYQYLMSQSDFDNQKKLVELSEKRTEDLQNRVRIGRSRQSELLLARVQVENALGQVQVFQRELEKFQTQIKQLSGLEQVHPQNESRPLPALQTLEDYLNKLDQNPEVQAKTYDDAVQANNVQIAFRNNFPDLELRANKYVHREALLRNVTWDVALNLTMPIFESGVTLSKLREESFKKNQTAFLLNDTKNILRSTVTQLYQTLSFDLNRIHNLQKALQLAEQNYQEQQKDYRLGLVSNLEVNQALNTFIETKKTYDRLVLEMAMNHQLLQAYTGNIVWSTL